MAVVASLGLLAAVGGVIVGALGTGTLVVRGAAAGLLLGWGGSAFELRVMVPHVQSDLPRAMRILTLGFGVRLLAILAGAVWLEDAGLADGTAFGTGIVGGFLAFLPVLASAVRAPAGNGEAHG
jgi:hypothetical protein